MAILPFTAARLLFTRPKLFFLGLFPGIFTFILSASAVYLLWATLLQGMSLWLSIPFMMMGFLLSWLLFGNISLLPVEDAIIDECQRAVLGDVAIRSPGMSFRRIGREALYSALLAFMAILFFLIALLPILNVVGFVFAAWLTAYGFLSSLYGRKEETMWGRIHYFFRDWLGNFLLGTLISFLLFVPVLNVFLLGYAQILATLVFLRNEKPILKGG